MFASFLLVLLSVTTFGAGNDARLANAVEKRDNETARSLLKQRIDVNQPQPHGATALHWAAHWDDVEMAELLIRAGADVNVRNENDITPLSLASTNGNAAMIEKLLKAGADANAAIREGETPLMLSARTGKVDAVRMLLTHKAELNTRERWNGQTALMWAVAEGHVAAVEALIQSGADIHSRSNSGLMALFFAVRQGSLDIVRLLLNAGVNVNETRPDGASPLLVAVLNGREDILDLLLERGADPNVEGGSTEMTRPGVRATPIPIDLTKAKTPAEEEKVWRGGDVHHTDLTRQKDNIWGTPLHALVFVAVPERSDVHWKVSIDKIRVAKALIAHGARVNAQSRSERPMFSGGRWHTQLIGATPFLLAAKQADIEFMRFLLANGADPTLAARNHTTPLMVAAGLAWTPGQDSASETETLNTVKLLVDLGADVNAVNDMGETPMHGAAYRGANSIVQFLVDKGGKVDVKDKRGWTPLTVANGVEYGAGTWDQPQTAALLRRLLAAGIPR